MNVKDVATENRMAEEAKDAKSEGLMDRKEVLGGRPVFVLGCIRTVQYFRFGSKNIFGAVHGDTNMPPIYNSLKLLFYSQHCFLYNINCLISMSIMNIISDRMCQLLQSIRTKRLTLQLVGLSHGF